MAASDPDTDCLNRAGARWGIERLYSGYREMLDREELDLVSVCTPTATHGEVLSDLLRSGRAYGILMEKPIATTLEEAQGLIELAADSPAVVSVNYGRRFCPVYRQVAREIQQERFGKLQYAHAVYTKGLYHNGTHLIDLLRWMMGEPLELTPMELVRDGGDPILSLRLTWGHGVTAWLQGADHEAFNLFELDLVFTKGRLRFVDQGHWLERYSVEDLTSTYGFRQIAPHPTRQRTAFDESIRFALKDLIQAIEQGHPPHCTLQDGREAMALAAQAVRKMEQVVGLIHGSH